MNAWTYETAEDLSQSLTERLKNFPREPDMLVYGVRACAALAVRTWLGVYHRLEIHEGHNIPTDRACVLVANHSSHLDAVCLLAALPLTRLHRAFPAAAADYFFQSLPRIWFAAIVVNALPFRREVNPRQSLALCQQLLCTPGNVLIIFPEGTRSPSGEIGKFKSGVGMLLAGRDIPVLPCYLKGAHQAWPKGKLLPRPTSVSVRIGTPRSYAERVPNKEAACTIAAELQQAVIDLKTSS